MFFHHAVEFLPLSSRHMSPVHSGVILGVKFYNLLLVHFDMKLRIFWSSNCCRDQAKDFFYLDDPLSFILCSAADSRIVDSL